MKAIQLKNEYKKYLILLCILLTACNTNESYKDEITLENVEVSEKYESVLHEGNVNNPMTKSLEDVKLKYQDLKIIKSASVRYKVVNVKKATDAIKNIALYSNAYVSELRFENNLYKIENRFTVKVPTGQFDVFMDSISNVAEFVEYENISTKDVTSEYIDLQARLKTKLEVKERYESILRKNAKTVEDILATEDKLRFLQEEIESAQGRLKYLSNKVAYSTIQIDLYETVAYKEAPEQYSKTFLSEIKQGLISGWVILKSLLIAIVHIWPLVILGVILFLYIKRRLKT